jgi:four helix bundle protein
LETEIESLRESLKSEWMDRAEAMKARTKQFAIRIVGVVRSLPRTRECAKAVAANYRALCRSRSHAEFISKMNIVVEEADETVFWLELLGDTGVVPAGKLALLIKEANELLAIRAASLRTAKQNKGA